MAFYKITYHQRYRFATLHNFGCTFRCCVCSYRVRSGVRGVPGQLHPRPRRFLSVDEMKRTLRSVPVAQVNFLGGEPTLAAELPQMLTFAKHALGAKTFLAHTNGSRLPLSDLDGANVGLKAWDEKVHFRYTGRAKQPIFDNFAAAVGAGLAMRANVVFVPGLVDLDQIEAISEWLAGLDREIPFQVVAYVPVPGQLYPRPTPEQLEAAMNACRKHLEHVESPLMSCEEALELAVRDERFAVRQIA